MSGENESITENILDKKAGLEQTYISLLEQRIAQLESLVNNDERKVQSKADTDPKAPSSAATNNTAAGQSASLEDETDANGKDVQDDKKADAISNDKKENAGSSPDTQKTEGSEDGNAKPEGPTKEQEPKVAARVRYCTWKYIRDKGWGDVDYTAEADTTVKEKQTSTIFRRIMDDDKPDKVDSYEIEMPTQELKRLYKEATMSSIPLDESARTDDSAMFLDSPFTGFMQHWTSFENACKPDDGDSEERATAREDLRNLLPLVRQSGLEPFFKAREMAFNRGIMSWEYLWSLYAPGTRVYAKTFLDDLHMLEVQLCQMPQTIEGKYDEKTMYVWCLGFDWDGTKFNTYTYAFELQENKSEKEIAINSLPVFPTSFYRNADGERADTQLREDLKTRGKRFWTLCNTNDDTYQYNYSGAVIGQIPLRSALASRSTKDMELDDKMSMYSTRDESSSRTASKKEYRGQIIIDAYSYLRTADTMIDEPPLGSLIVMPHGESDCLCQVCRRSPVITWRDKEVPKKATKEQFELFAASPDRLMMCPPRVLGYALKSKTWAQFRIRSCKDAISEQKSYFAEQLQLKDDYKKMLLAVVNSHRGTLRSAEAAPEDAKASLPRSLDVIEGKGKGLAILLHGPPGVGKTLTAESIALATGRSLLTVSVAEIGTAADWAEDRLNIFFVLAARWGAILLVDEADVFLEERTQNDGANRNALVSVLLRCLEYYEGIIFLTTNRITSIDVAVQSRMHIAIQFENLKADQRYAIYKYHLDKVPDVKIKGDRDRLYSEVKSRFCRKRQALNGRQIRNIVSTALSLAGDRERNPDENGPSDGKLRISDLERVHETTTDFLESMKDTMDKWRRKNEALGEDD